MTFFVVGLIGFLFFVNFVKVADGQTCSDSNRMGTCSILSCGNLCEKRHCVKKETHAAPDVATISSITVGVLVLFAIILVVAVKWIRSRRDAPDRKLSVRSAENSYTFRNYPRPPMTCPANSNEYPRPPLPSLGDEDENPYEYETVDFPEPEPQRTNPTVQETESGYLIPTPLTKPKLPPPRIWNSTN